MLYLMHKHECIVYSIDTRRYIRGINDIDEENPPMALKLHVNKDTGGQPAKFDTQLGKC